MKKSFTEILSIELSRLFLPLKKLETPNDVKQFLGELGWEIPLEEEVTGNIEAFINIASAVKEILAVIKSINGANQADLTGLLQVLWQKANATIAAIQEEIPRIKNTIEQLPIAAGTAHDIAGKLPIRIGDYLIITYLTKYQPKLFATTKLLGICELVKDDADQKIKTVHWDRIVFVFSNPKELFSRTYKWGDDDFDSSKLLTNLKTFAHAYGIPSDIYEQSDTVRLELGRDNDDKDELRIPIYFTGVAPDDYSEISFNISPAPDPNGGVPGLYFYPAVSAKGEIDLSTASSKWDYQLGANVDLSMALGLQLMPPAGLKVTSDLPAESELSVLITQKDNATPYVLIGSEEGSNASYQGLTFRAFVTGSEDNQNFGVELDLASIQLIVAPGEDRDGFLQKILPGGFRSEFGFSLGYSLQDGLYFVGSGTFEIHFAKHIQLGPLEISGLNLSFVPKSDSLNLNLGSNLKLELGPFTTVVENIGLNTAIDFQKENGNLGLIDLSVGFKPPTGIGLSIETSTIVGGGYLAFYPEEEQYAGALELLVVDSFAITAIGLVSTIYDTDGSKSYSLLLIVSVQFSPGIALGMGFFLTGLGGMVGIHRTVNVDALRAGVKNNAIDHILFPENVIENIQEIITNIREIFPPQKDQFLLGLMAKIVYGSPVILSVEFGVIVEFPDPTRIAILGVIKTVLPDPKNVILQLQINFVGILDFDKQYISFDASIYNSRLLTITLEGDMAFRLFWGREKAFLLSVGGFHPSFQPSQSLRVGNMKRLTATLLSGNPSLSLEAYFAITSNTVQFGSQINFLYKKSGFKVIGYFGFDAIFQFRPFSFIANIRAGVAVKKGKKTLLYVKLTLELRGPKPWIAKGNAEFKVLVKKIRVSFNKTWGDSGEIELPKVPILPLLLEAFQQDDNWTSEVPDKQFLLVTLREVELPVGAILLHPQGKFTIKENVFPLGMVLSKFGNDQPADINKAWIDRVVLRNSNASISPVTSAFAPASFQAFSNEQKLSAPSYAEEKSGVEITDTNDLQLNYAINHTVEYEVRVSDFDNTSGEEYGLEKTKKFTSRRVESNRLLFSQLAKNGVARKSFLAKRLKQKGEKINGKTLQIESDKFSIVSNEDLSVYQDIDFSAGSKAEAESQLDQLLRSSSELKNKLIIVPELEAIA